MGIRELLPFLIPLVIVQSGLLTHVFHHISTRSAYRHGNRMVQIVIVVVGMQLIDPVLYLIFDRENAQWLS